MIQKPLAISLFFFLLCSSALAPAQCTRCAPGLAMTPAALNFGSVTIGKHSAGRKVSIRSVGTIPASIGRIGIRGGASTQTNNCPRILPHGSGCTVTVIFRPIAAQTFTGQLTVTYNGTFKAVTTLTGQGTK